MTSRKYKTTRNSAHISNNSGASTKVTNRFELSGNFATFGCEQQKCELTRLIYYDETADSGWSWADFS